MWAMKMLTFAAAQDEIFCRATKAIPDDVATLVLSFEFANEAALVEVDHVYLSFRNIDNDCSTVPTRCDACNLRRKFPSKLFSVIFEVVDKQHLFHIIADCEY